MREMVRYSGVYAPFFRKRENRLQMVRTLKDSFDSILPTDKKQKPQIDFLRFLCYNRNASI